MPLHEENYKKILADNPGRDPYVLEQGIEAIRNDTISDPPPIPALTALSNLPRQLPQPIARESTRKPSLPLLYPLMLPSILMWMSLLLSLEKRERWKRNNLPLYLSGKNHG
jgi:hypothetical protein